MIVRTEQMLDEMCATLGGRAAEKIVFDKILQEHWGFRKSYLSSESHGNWSGLNDEIGNITYYDSTGQTDYNFSKPYSEETAQVIDKEISKIIEAHGTVPVTWKQNQDKLTALAERLLEKEVIFKDDRQILGKRPFPDKSAEAEAAHKTMRKKRDKRRFHNNRFVNRKKYKQGGDIDQFFGKKKLKKGKRYQYLPEQNSPTHIEFAQNYVGRGGKFVYCEDAKDTRYYFDSILQENNWSPEDVLPQNEILSSFFGLSQAVKHPKAMVLHCEYLIANKGAILICNRQIQDRKLSDLPDNLIIMSPMTLKRM